MLFNKCCFAVILYKLTISVKQEKRKAVKLCSFKFCMCFSYLSSLRILYIIKLGHSWQTDSFHSSLISNYLISTGCNTFLFNMDSID